MAAAHGLQEPLVGFSHDPGSRRSIEEGTSRGKSRGIGGGGGGGQTVKIVSDLPLQGANRAQTTTIVNAIEMAIEERGGKAGSATVEYESLDDATAQAGQWDEAKCAENAQTAAQDEEIVGWIGPFNSGCAAVEIPILNEAGLGMISPANTYIGLTKPGGEPDEPEKYYPTGELIKDKVGAGMSNDDVLFIGPDGIFVDTFISQAGNAAEGAYITFGGLPQSELTAKGQQFVQDYESQHDDAIQPYTAYAYEAANVMLDAIERASKEGAVTREAVLQQIFATEDFDGVLGTWSFDEDGDTSLTELSIQRVENGQFEYQRTIDAGDM